MGDANVWRAWDGVGQGWGGWVRHADVSEMLAVSKSVHAYALDWGEWWWGGTFAIAKVLDALRSDDASGAAAWTQASQPSVNLLLHGDVLLPELLRAARTLQQRVQVRTGSRKTFSKGEEGFKRSEPLGQIRWSES